MLKRVFFNAIMFSIPAAFALVAFEFGFSQFYYSNTSNISDKRFDPIIGWRLAEGDHWIKPPHSFRKHVTSINSHGLRNRNISDENDPSVRRVIVLGDSFTFGQVTPEDKLFTTLLESKLNFQGSPRYEVINAGVPGYGSGQELLLMRSLAEQNVAGELYLLMLFTNDILDIQRLSYSRLRELPVRPGFQLDEEGIPQLVHLPKISGAYQSDSLVSVGRETRRTKTFQILARNIELFFQSRPGLINSLSNMGFSVEMPRMPALINGWYRPDILSAAIPLQRALIGEIKNEAEERGARLIVSLIPSAIQVYADTYGGLLQNTFPERDEIEAWLIPVPQANLYVPYHISIPTPWGTATVTAKAFEVAPPGKGKIALVR